MSVKPEFVGRTGQCPRCKQPITVPPQSQTRPPGQGGPPPPPPQHAQQTQPYGRPVATPPPSHPAHHAQPQRPPVGPGSGRVGPARLEVAHGPAGLVGKTYPIDGSRPAVIGRDPQVEVSVPSDRVSRKHCQLVPNPNGGGYIIQDLGSSNGTLINQIRLNGQQPLKNGDYIQTGDCLFRFVFG